MADNGDKDVFTFTGFGGLRNIVSQESFDPGDLVTALNVDVTDAKRIRRRRGFSAAKISGSYHSLWSDSDGAICLVVSGSSLYLMSAAYVFTAIRSDLTAGRYMNYVSVGDRVFYSNGVDSGVVQGGLSRTWGIVPPLQPAATVTGGDLPPGRYQFALTYVREDGQESGSPRAGVVDLAVTGGIGFVLPVSDDPSIREKRLYVSPLDGDALYYHGSYSPSETAGVYAQPLIGGLPLETQFLSPPPPADELGYHGGRIYAASGRVVHYSEPFSPELFDLRKNYVFTTPVALVAPVKDGIYFGTDTGIYWVAGTDPGVSDVLRLADYGVHRGTLAYGPADAVVSGGRGMAAFFASKQGICFAPVGGGLVNLTNDRFNYPPMDRGAGVFRDTGGSPQYVAVLQGTEQQANTAF